MSPQDYMDAMNDAKLVDGFHIAVDDLQKASVEKPNSEWHEACFAAVIVFCNEINKRKINMPAMNQEQP